MATSPTRVVSPQRASERLLVQVRGTVDDALRGLTDGDLTGLVCTGVNALAELRRLRRSPHVGARVPDPEYYTRTAATVHAPMAADDSGLVPVTADMLTEAQRDAGATRVITPTLYLRAGEIQSVSAAVDLANRMSSPDVVFHAPLDARWLDTSVPALVRVLRRSLHPVALTLVGQFDPVAKNGRAAAFRRLVASLPGCWLLRVDPLVALDGLAHGAACAAVGVTGGLRHAVAPGETSESSGFNPPPGVFLRALMTIRNSDTVAAWYANDPAPTCQHPLCGGRPLDTFYANPNDKAAAALHNAHSWVDLAAELLAQPLHTRAEWLHRTLQAALLSHDWLPGTNGVQVKPHRLLAAYVALGP